MECAETGTPQRRQGASVDPRVILVTGAGSGIGRATALLFSRDGDSVAVLDRDQTAGTAVAEEIISQGGRALFVHADIQYPAQVQSAVDATLSAFGRLDILFANAALQKNAPLEDTTLDEWNQVLSVNLTGTFLCCKAVVEPMKAQGGGSIVICSSGHAFNTYPGYAAYGTTKAGLLALTRSAALDLAQHGIRVNCIVPGATETPLLRYHFDRAPQDEQRLLAKIPMRRLASPEDIAKGVRLLCSPDAAYITGTWLAVDGGLLAHG